MSSRFLGNDIIVGHNTSFDVRFLAAGFQENINNEYMDTMQFARKLYPDLPHHRPSDLSEYLNLTNNEHRGIADCVTTMELYEAMKTEMAQKGLGIRGSVAGKFKRTQWDRHRRNYSDNG